MLRTSQAISVVTAFVFDRLFESEPAVIHADQF